MNSDEINRTIDFILQSQANAAARMGESDKILGESGGHVRKLSQSTRRFHEEMEGYIKILASLLETQSRCLDRLNGQA